MSCDKDIVEINNQPKTDKKKEKGASMVEYALLVALIAVICILALRGMGSQVSKQFSAIASQLT